MKFTAHIPKTAKVPLPKNTPQIAAKLGALIGGKSRARVMANAPDRGVVGLPRPDKAVGNARGTGYQGRMPVLGVANSPNPYQM